MKSFPLRSDRASLTVTETGGHLSEVVFTLAGGRTLSPMHTAPWADEQLAADTPPIIRVLRGDFFCAPFGASDLLPEAPWVHGLPASGNWTPTASRPDTLDAVLEGTVLGATITKHVEVRPGEAVVYQRHTLSGGSGRLPIGHHAMLRAESQLHLSFAPWTQALTPPEPMEVEPEGHPLLVEGQAIPDLHRAPRVGGGTVDLTVYPTPDGTEALWMLVAKPTSGFGWTAATCADQGWIWFALKDPRILPQTVVWMSNGGRDYAPWNGRHRRAIGLEEVCGYFHLGHKASLADNPIAAAGSPTAVTLEPGGAVEVSYMFGVAEAPARFGAVTDIVAAPGGVRLIGEAGREVFAACDPSFVSGQGIA